MRLQVMLIVLLLLVPVPAHGASREAATVEVTALAVTETTQGFQGVPATVQATVLTAGTGQVFVSTKPLADTDMQGSARLAARVAANTLGLEHTRYDYLVEFRSDSSVIGGPSAGGVMTLALMVALHNVAYPDDPWTLNPRVAGTGTINPDGTIGPVGGVPAKASAARESGIHTFLYPAGLDIAADLRPGTFGLQTVAVDMQQHCTELQIACRAVATIESYLEAAVGVRLERPPVDAPTTVDYAAQLRPSVEAQIEDLQARIDNRLAPPAGADEVRIEALWRDVAGRLETAEEALAAQQFYLAATRSFQGHIFAGRAENLTQFVGDAREGVVTNALDACHDASTDAMDAVRGLDATGLNQVQALAAAQDRAHSAVELHAQGLARYETARVYNDWIDALFTAVFCVERAKTVHWWLELGDAFGAGPTIRSVDQSSQEAIDQASELIAYASAVTGTIGPASARLEAARAMQNDNLRAGALAAAIDAQSLAALQVQTAASQEVPQAVLAAAREGAERAIAGARVAGAEPLLPVSLVELADAQEDPADALDQLWTARTLALLRDAPPVPPAVQPVPSYTPTGVGYDDGSLLAAMVIGAILGATVIGLAWALRPARPRD